MVVGGGVGGVRNVAPSYIRAPSGMLGTRAAPRASQRYGGAIASPGFVLTPTSRYLKY